MFATLWNLLSGGWVCKSEKESNSESERRDKSELSSTGRALISQRKQLSASSLVKLSNSNLRQVRSSWTHGRYTVPESVSNVQFLNLIYAPKAVSLLRRTESQTDSANFSGTRGEVLDFSPRSARAVTSRPLPPARRSAREVITDIVSHPDDEVRRLIASNELTPEIGLRALANDRADVVKLALISNANCPADVLKSLVSDDNSFVSFRAVDAIRARWTKLKRTA